MTNAYDGNGNRTGSAAAIDGQADFVNQCSYDNLNRLIELAQSGASGTSGVAAKRIDFQYNASGQYTSIARYADLAGTLNVATTAYAYSPRGQLRGGR